MKGVQNTVKRPESFSHAKLLIVEVMSLISVVMLSLWFLLNEYHVLFH